MSARVAERNRRGSSLIEVLVASAVLAVGLTAVVSLLVHGMNQSNNGIRQFEAAAFGASRLNQLAMSPVGSLNAGTFDAGAVYKGGVVQYSSTMTVELLGALSASSDGGSASSSGAPWPGYRITLRVDWRDSFLIQRSRTYTTIVSEAYDGGL